MFINHVKQVAVFFRLRLLQWGLLKVQELAVQTLKVRGTDLLSIPNQLSAFIHPFFVNVYLCNTLNRTLKNRALNVRCVMLICCPLDKHKILIFHLFWTSKKKKKSKFHTGGNNNNKKCFVYQNYIFLLLFKTLQFCHLSTVKAAK